MIRKLFEGLMHAVLLLGEEVLDRVLGIVALTFINMIVGAFIWAVWNNVLAVEFGLTLVSYGAIWLGLVCLDLIARTITK